MLKNLRNSILMFYVCLAAENDEQMQKPGVYKMKKEQDNHECISTTEFTFAENTHPKDKSHFFDFCQEHAKHTCCMAHDVDRIHTRYKTVKDASHMRQSIYEVSKDCLEMTRQFWCSNCDGDLGTHVRQGYCELRCQFWYISCQNDYFVPKYIDGEAEGQHLSFPMEESDLWKVKPLRSLYDSAEDFCRDMGGYEINEDPETCYEGVPSATKFEIRSSELKRRAEKSGIDHSLVGKIVSIFKQFKKNSVYILYLSLAIMIVYGVYLFVLWQEKKADEWIEQERRQKRIDKVKQRRAIRKEEQKIREELEKKEKSKKEHIKDD